MPDVTVILPVHNGANYLQESLDSVLAQEFTDFELHVLDDASTDLTPQIAQATGDPRVHYSRNPERFGLFKTLNRGFAEAQSPWVRIWAHDDRMLPHSLGAFMDFARTHPRAGMIYGDFFEIDPAGQRTGHEETYREQRMRTPELALPRLSALLFFIYGCLPGNISTVLVRREAWQAVGGFLETIQQAPDYDMWVRISAHYEVGFIRKKVIELRDHPLQLGKAGQKQMTTIEEELGVYRQLRQRLEGVLSNEEFRRYWCKHRGRQHVHWIAMNLLGNFTTARRGWRALRGYGQPWRQTWAWLISLNGRLLRLDSGRFFDSKGPSLSRDLT